MTASSIITLVLGLLQLVLNNLKSSTANSALDAAIAGIESAIEELTVVQGTPVTFQQLQSLRVEPKW
jgi:hypothetical protein